MRPRPAQSADQASQAFRPEDSPFYFPGREEFDEAGRDPRFTDIYDREGDEFAVLRREAYLIQLAAANALKEYKKTGNVPTLAEMREQMPEFAALAAEGGSEPPAVAGGLTPRPANIDESDEICYDESNNSHLKPPAIAGGSDLKRSLDAYGREIFIEKEDERGKPTVWYKFDSKGRKQRMIKKGHTTLIEQVE